jgi:hypothetical protein
MATQPPTPTPEQRIAALEEQVRLLVLSNRPHPAERLLHGTASGGGVARGLLTFGQVVSVLTCVASLVLPMVAIFLSWQSREVAAALAPAYSWAWLSVLVGFFYSAAMYVVFTRCKRMA